MLILTAPGDVSHIAHAIVLMTGTVGDKLKLPKTAMLFGWGFFCCHPQS